MPNLVRTMLGIASVTVAFLRPELAAASAVTSPDKNPKAKTTSLPNKPKGNALKTNHASTPNAEAKQLQEQALIIFTDAVSLSLKHEKKTLELAIKKFDAAIKKLEKAIELAPNNGWLHHSLGQAFNQRAVTCSERAKLSATSVEEFSRNTQLYYEASRNADTSVENLRRALTKELTALQRPEVLYKFSKALTDSTVAAFTLYEKGRKNEAYKPKAIATIDEALQVINQLTADYPHFEGYLKQREDILVVQERVLGKQQNNNQAPTLLQRLYMQ